MSAPLRGPQVDGSTSTGLELGSQWAAYDATDTMLPAI